MPLFPPSIPKLVSKGDVPGLIKVLKTEQRYWMREGAVKALSNFKDRPEVVEALGAALRDPVRSVQEAAAEALGKVGGEPAVLYLVDWLQANQDSSANAIVTKALVEIGHPAVELLLARISRGRGEWAAIRLLGELHDPSAIPGLVGLLADRERQVAVIEALGRLGGSEAVEALIHFIATFEPEPGNDGIWRAAQDALQRIGDPRAIRPLVLFWAKAQVKERGVEGFDESAVRERAVQSDVRNTTSRTLSKFGEMSVPVLLAGLKDSSAVVREICAGKLAEVATGRAVRPLVEALHDRDEFISDAAARALGRIKDKQAVEPLIAELKLGGKHTARIIEALGNLGDERARDPIAAEIDQHPKVVLVALTKLKDWRAIGPHLSVLQQPLPLGAYQDIADVPHWGAFQALSQLLPDNIARLSAVQLTAISQLSDLSIRLKYTDTNWVRMPGDSDSMEISTDVDQVQEIDCAGLRQLAARELGRRGNVSPQA